MHDVLRSPGTADLTADVDFGAMAKAAAGKGGCGCVYLMTAGLGVVITLVGVRNGPQLETKCSGIFWGGGGGGGVLNFCIFVFALIVLFVCVHVCACRSWLLWPSYSE